MERDPESRKLAENKNVLDPGSHPAARDLTGMTNYDTASDKEGQTWAKGEEVIRSRAMKSTITRMGDKVTIDVDRADFYDTMLEAIADRVFQLLGPEFDKQAYLDEVEKGRPAVEIGQELAIPVSIMLSLELGYCLGQLKYLGKSLDYDEALKDLYAVWKRRLKTMLKEEMSIPDSVH